MTKPLPIRIKIGPTSADPSTRIEVDGVDLAHHITNFEVRAGVGIPTEVRLSFLNVEVDIEGHVESTAMGDDWTTYRLGRIIRDQIQEGVEAHD